MTAETAQFYVRSSDGTSYRVGQYVDGEWVPGDRALALRELAGLGEPGAYVWGRTTRRRRMSRSPARPVTATEHCSRCGGVFVHAKDCTLPPGQEADK